MFPPPLILSTLASGSGTAETGIKHVTRCQQHPLPCYSTCYALLGRLSIMIASSLPLSSSDTFEVSILAHSHSHVWLLGVQTGLIHGYLGS